MGVRQLSPVEALVEHGEDEFSWHQPIAEFVERGQSQEVELLARRLQNGVFSAYFKLLDNLTGLEIEETLLDVIKVLRDVLLEPVRDSNPSIVVLIIFGC